MRLKTFALAVASALAATLTIPAQAQTEIQWWHSMDGGLNDWVNDLAKNFNASQKEYKIVPMYKGELRPVAGRRHRRLSRRQCAGHPAGLRSRHGHDDVLQEGRGQARGRA